MPYNLTPVADNVDFYNAAHINDLQTAVENMGAESYVIAAPDAPDAIEARSNITTDGTNDEVQFLDAFAAGYKRVVGVGSFNLQSNDLTVPAGAHLHGIGRGATLFTPSTGVGIRIESSANKASVEGFSMNLNSHVLGDYGIRVLNSTHAVVRDIDAYNAGGFAVFIDAGASQTTEKVIVEGCSLVGKGVNDVIGGGPQNSANAFVRQLIIRNNFIAQDVTTSGGTYLNAIGIAGASYIDISNNWCWGAVEAAPEQYPQISINMSHNHVFRAVGSSTNTSLGVRAPTSPATTNESILCVGNQLLNAQLIFEGTSSFKTRGLGIHNNIVYTTNVQNGIHLLHCQGGTITGNFVDGVTAGIYFESCDQFDVSSNFVRNGDYGIRDVTGVATIGGTGNTFADIATDYIIGGRGWKNSYPVNPDGYFNHGDQSGAFGIGRYNAENIRIRLTGNMTLSITAGKFIGDEINLILEQDGTGSRLMTWPSNFKKVGGTLTLSTAAGAIDVIKMKWDGTNWREVSRALNAT